MSTGALPMRYLYFLTLTILSLLLISTAWAEGPTAMSCQSSHITLHSDDRNGLYDGMSQGGTALVLHNTGEVACTLPPLPELRFSDAEYKPLMAERSMVRGMHPGPVLQPVTVASGKYMQIVLRWVASDAFDGGNCIRPAFVSLELDGGALTVPFDRQMCAAKGRTGYYSQSMTSTP